MGTISITFGTHDIRDEAPPGPVECVRVYPETSREDKHCGHLHRSRASALKCARSLARGDDFVSGPSYVETRTATKATTGGSPALRRALDVLMPHGFVPTVAENEAMDVVAERQRLGLCVGCGFANCVCSGVPCRGMMKR